MTTYQHAAIQSHKIFKGVGNPYCSVHKVKSLQYPTHKNA